MSAQPPGNVYLGIPRGVPPGLPPGMPGLMVPSGPPSRMPGAMVPPGLLSGMPGMVPPGPLSGMPGMVPQGPLSGMPGMVPSGPPSRMPGAMVPPGPLSGMPGMVPHGPLSGMPGMVPPGPLSGMPGMVTHGPPATVYPTGPGTLLQQPTAPLPLTCGMPVMVHSGPPVAIPIIDNGKASIGDLYVKLSNGDEFKVLKKDDGSLYYIDKGIIKKVRKNQHLFTVQSGDVEGAAGGLMFATDSELFRATLPSFQAIWNANGRIDKYTGFSQEKTENMKFEDLSSVVKKYENYDKERAVKVERDHIVEIQMVSQVWDRVNNGRQPNTRAALKPIRDNVNALENLNCTPGAINMKKESAVRRFLTVYRESGKGLRDHLLDYGMGPYTTRRICTTYEEAACQIADEVQKKGKDVYDDFADEITSLVGHMKLY